MCLLELGEAKQVLGPVRLTLRQGETLFHQVPCALLEDLILSCLEEGLQFEGPGAQDVLVLGVILDDLLEDQGGFVVTFCVEKDFSLLEQDRRCFLTFRIQPEVILVGREQGVRIDSFFGA